jgi:hypothetical protein
MAAASGDGGQGEAVGVPLADGAPDAKAPDVTASPCGTI